MPSDLDDARTVVFEGDDDLRLHDMWLGSASSGPQTRSCQQNFNRIRRVMRQLPSGSPASK